MVLHQDTDRVFWLFIKFRWGKEFPWWVRRESKYCNNTQGLRRTVDSFQAGVRVEGKKKYICSETTLQERVITIKSDNIYDFFKVVFCSVLGYTALHLHIQ